VSNWDLGFGLESANPHEQRYPPPPTGPGGPGGPGGADPQPGNTGWPGNAGWYGTEVPPGDGDLPDAPYPITFERDDFEGRPPWETTGQHAAAPPPVAVPLPNQFDGDQYVDGAPDRSEPWSAGPLLGHEDGADLMQALYPDNRSGRRRWLIPAGIAVLAAVIGGTLVLLSSSTRPSAPAAAGTSRPTAAATPAASRPAKSQPAAPGKAVAAGAPLTLAAAEGALATYTTLNNSANAQRSDSELAMVEAGGSYAIDAGVYTIGRAGGQPPYPAFAPVTATYYIPQAEPAGGPRWFVARVANAFSAHPKKVTSTEYLLFTQPATGGAWRNTVEPYLLAGANAPQIAVGGNGLAEAMSVSATSLADAPGQLAGLTAASLDGTGRAISVPAPGELPDRVQQKLWQATLPNATVTDTHAAATGSGSAGQTFTLLTTNGGALVFYTDAADLTITPPAGSMLRLTVPGFYSAADPVTRAGLAYLDQFAAYDPPQGAGPPIVIADYAGPTGKN
jgi:hypothetical protein